MTKTCFVTGGSSGIGKGIVLAMAKAGYDVAFLHLEDHGAAQEVVQSVHELGHRCVAASIDLSEADGPRHAAEFALQSLNRIDVLVNNAGVSMFEETGSMTVDVTDRLLAVNYRSPILLTSLVANHMIEQQIQGNIVFTASTRGIQAYPGDAVYGGLKAALIRSAKSIALDLAPHGIRVNCVAPGAIQVRFSEGVNRHYQKLGRRIPLGRSGNPSDIANAVVWLVSDGASYITGTTIQVDGGLILPGMPERVDGDDPGWGRPL